MCRCHKRRTLKFGKGRICQKGNDLAFLSLGTIIEETEKAIRQLEEEGLSVTLADARFAKPFDKEMIKHHLCNNIVLWSLSKKEVAAVSQHMDAIS